MKTENIDFTFLVVDLRNIDSFMHSDHNNSTLFENFSEYGTLQNRVVMTNMYDRSRYNVVLTETIRVMAV